MTAKQLKTITTSEVAHYLNISEGRVRHLVRDNVLHPLVALGKKPFRFDPEQVTEDIKAAAPKAVSSLKSESVKAPKSHKRRLTSHKKREELWQT